MSEENRHFRMHPDLLKSVIKNQAGSFEKAVLELLMNSIDAGATKVNITLDRNTLAVKDDGRGFASREEIDLYFEQFGTPHEAGDARFGRFRIGRGQVFAFSKNQWRSSEFEMTVDIENADALTYKLRTGLRPVRGCTITAELYKPLSPSEVISTGNALRHQCRFAPIPIFLNKERINVDVEKEQWTEITDEAYIKITSSARDMTIYNLGIFVRNEDASLYGTGGDRCVSQATGGELRA